jgi:type IV pilus assembly protein PilV
MNACFRAPAARRPPPQRQRGISMVELLVSLLIFSFGMLGLAGLQTRTLSFNQSSLYRSQATALGDDVLDRMRADRQNAVAGLWDTALTTNAAGVTGSELYKTDLKLWKQSVEALLPSGKGSVGVDSGTVTVIITWDDSRSDRDDPTQSWKTVTGL